MDFRQNEAWKRRRAVARHHQPERIRLLLVDDAPPAGDRGFYLDEARDEDPLFPEVCEVLFEARPTGSSKTPWLKELRRRGIFLVEMKPSAPLRKGEKLDSYVPWLVLACQSQEPEHIVLVNAAAYDAGFDALRAAGLPVMDVRIPSPRNGRQVEFRRLLRQALVRAELESLVRPLRTSEKAH